ncbi:MAG: hypothetical protein ABIG42_05255 [bacterium]
MRAVLFTIFIIVFLSVAGCANNTTTPYVPPDTPTQEEIDDLVGDWFGYSDTYTGLTDQLDLVFYETAGNLMVTFYLNNTYIDDLHVEYDGDNVRFTSFSILGQYGEFVGIIDHSTFNIRGEFFYQDGFTITDGTFEVNKL